MAEGGSIAYKHGLAFIFTHSEDGLVSEKDVEALERVFQSMNIKTEIYISMTFTEVQKELWNLKDDHEGLKDVDFVIIVITNNVIKSIFHRIFLDPLCQIKALDGKLKWVIIKACDAPKKLLSKTKADTDMENHYAKYYLVSHAASKGSVSYRHNEEGSIYIQLLCEQLREHSATCGLLQILDKTAELVATRFDELKKKGKKIYNRMERPTYETNLDEDFFFFNK